MLLLTVAAARDAVRAKKKSPKTFSRTLGVLVEFLSKRKEKEKRGQRRKNDEKSEEPSVLRPASPD